MSIRRAARRWWLWAMAAVLAVGGPASSALLAQDQPAPTAESSWSAPGDAAAAQSAKPAPAATAPPTAPANAQPTAPANAQPAAPANAQPAAPVTLNASSATTVLPPETLPQFNQDEIVKQQLARLDTARQDLRLMLFSAESQNFLLFSDLDSRVRNAVLIWLEDLRSKLINQLGMSPDERFWDGKCLVLVFAKQESLVDYGRRFDNHDVGRSRGYFMLEARQCTGPRLVHIATFQPLQGGNEHLREILVHETTHALIELYQKSSPLPLWVHEGLAEYMTVVMDPSLRQSKQSLAFKRATANPYDTIQPLFGSVFPASDLTGYSVSFSLVDYLQSLPRSHDEGLLKMVELMKDKVEPCEALGRAFGGFGFDDLERRWKDYVQRNYRPAVQPDSGRAGR